MLHFTTGAKGVQRGLRAVVPVPVPGLFLGALRRSHVQFLLKGLILHCQGTVVQGPFVFVTLPKLESPDAAAHRGFGSPSVVPSDEIPIVLSDVAKRTRPPIVSVTDLQGV